MELILAMRWADTGAAAGTEAAEAAEAGRALEAEYLVKWEGLAHVHCEWLAERELEALSPRKLRNYVEKVGRAPADASDKRNWLPQRCVARREAVTGDEEVLVKWDGAGTGLPYDLATWERAYSPALLTEDGRALMAALQAREAAARTRASPAERAAAAAARAPAQPTLVKAHPPWLAGGDPGESGTGPRLMPHQIESLNFLRSSYHRRANVILADEMGLGKTVSALAYMRALEAEYHAPRPCLAVVPLSTLANWAAEARVWAPQSNVLVLHGNRGARQVVRDHELHLPVARKGEKAIPKVGIVLTTYEMVIGDLPLFRSVAWESLVLDEGHRLKGGPASRGFDSLAQLDVAHRVLLTGTPVQNNLEELFNLLHFLRPDLFPSFAAFTAEVNARAGGEGGKMAALIALAQPHMLRRVKKDVLAKLPPRREVHVPVELSPLQTEWYRAMLTRNYELLAGTGAGAAGAVAARATKLHNMVMQLRKVANHPYLIDGTEPAEGAADAAATAMLRVAASGKLALLDAMLTQLRQRGHRVLVFSQMVRMLDVLEDFCRDRFGTDAYERVDGGVLAGARQAAIARFNEPDSSRFVFLLSTRACGLGINLASADTVVIFDSGT